MRVARAMPCIKQSSLYSRYKWLLCFFLFSAYTQNVDVDDYLRECAFACVLVLFAVCVREFGSKHAFPALVSWRELWFWAIYTKFDVFFIIINNKNLLLFLFLQQCIALMPGSSNWYFKWVFVHVTNMRPVFCRCELHVNNFLFYSL